MHLETPLTVKERVLIVDDDDSVREALQKVLREVGYEVALASDAREVVEQLEKEPIDLLLLDLNLPDQSCCEILEHLATYHPFVPIIVTDQPSQGLAADVAVVLEKPIEVTTLLKTIETLLAAPKKMRATAKCLCPPQCRAALEWTCIGRERKRP